MDWSNVVSAVATAEGLRVTERGADGAVGARSYLLPYRSAAHATTPHLLPTSYVSMELLPNTGSQGKGSPPLAVLGPPRTVSGDLSPAAKQVLCQWVKQQGNLGAYKFSAAVWDVTSAPAKNLWQGDYRTLCF